jgi:hypothetical protein
MSEERIPPTPRVPPLAHDSSRLPSGPQAPSEKKEVRPAKTNQGLLHFSALPRTLTHFLSLEGKTLPNLFLNILLLSSNPGGGFNVK